jgi:hypothetical protein
MEAATPNVSADQRDACNFMSALASHRAGRSPLTARVPKSPRCHTAT